MVGERKLIEHVTFVGLDYEEDTEAKWRHGSGGTIFDMGC